MLGRQAKVVGPGRFRTEDGRGPGVRLHVIPLRAPAAPAGWAVGKSWPFEPFGE